MNDWSYNCFAKALADAIADAATPRESSNASGNAPCCDRHDGSPLLSRRRLERGAVAGDG
jgi:hypothetical protein